MVLAVLLMALLVQEGDPRVRRLIAELDGLPENFSAEAFVKRPAVQELIALQEDAAPALAEALRNSSRWSVRASAAYILGEIRHSAPLLDRHSEKHPLVRSFVLEGLAKNGVAGIHVEENGETVFKPFDFSHPGVPESAAEAARERAVLDEPHLTLRLSKLVALLGRRVRDESGEQPPVPRPPNFSEDKIRRTEETERAIIVLKTLTEGNARAAIEQLIAVFGQNSDPAVRADALDTLTASFSRAGDLYPADKLEALGNRLEAIGMQALRDASSELRYRAILLLQATGDDPKILAALEEQASRDAHPIVRHMAQMAVNRLKGVPPPPAPQKEVRVAPPDPRPGEPPRESRPSSEQSPSSTRSILAAAVGVAVLAILIAIFWRGLRSRTS